MKLIRHLIEHIFFSLILWITLSGCQEDEKGPEAPIITISEEFKHVDNFSVGEEIRIGVNVKSSIGVRRLAYYFVTRTANGTSSGTPVTIDKVDFPLEINEEIVFKVAPDLVELVIISFDRKNNNSEIHFTPANIRTVPVLTFKDNVKYRETVFENKVLNVEGLVTSEFDLSAVTYQTIVNGTASEEKAIALADKKQVPFVVNVLISKGLTGIIIKAENIYKGIAADTFRIATVVGDGVNITLEGGKTTIPIAYVNSENTLNGTVSSGSPMSSLTYAIKANGVYGTEVPITIGNPNDEFSFVISFAPDKTIEAIRISGQNGSGKTKVSEFVVEKVYTKLLHFADVKLTSAVGSGLNNWFSAYRAPHVFDVANAAANDVMMDFALIKFNATNFYIMAPSVFAAGADYKNATAPYMTSFSKAPYTMITVNRNAIAQDAFNSLEWDGQMMEFLDTKVRGPVASGGENYNFYGTNRRFNNSLKPGAGFIIGWGQFDPTQNKAFGIVMVKEFNVTNGVATATLEIKVPAEDNRTKYNPVSILDYEP
ncbi:hypothetical protein [Chryseosolibacter indicus]|uniref:Major fimbrial subunit protein N-terminal domain-containing protein n=1 Tax=Chryseosolibacter indicus TaxID=2782351 RepID=A0ABS5VT59_9BACT|nr:hypothetical protein [Chryseosolibacter indicus]MBT1704622.1 hypothetical protein [Chryseosolibacter indicus]